LITLRRNQMNYDESLAQPAPAVNLAAGFHRIVSGIALASFALVLIETLFNLHIPGMPGWPDGLMLFSVTTSTISALSRHLPLQNVLLGATIIAAIGTLAHGISAATAIPLGPIHYTAAFGHVEGYFAWPVPMLWVTIVLNSRGLARLILRPWRKVRPYGFWLMGITAALTVLTDAALEPYAGVVKRYWLWEVTRIPLTWGGAPVTNFLGWALTTGLILAFATPALIDKRVRPKQRIPDYHPLIVWLLGLALCGLGAATHQLWIATTYCAGLATVTATFAIRGGRW
jgi:uncharacterized membrane protein